MNMSQQVEQEQQTKFISGLSEVVDSHDVFLLDMWGVMHDGIQPYEHVLNTITNLVGQADNNKKELIILSNSSKRMQNSIKMLTKLGFLNSDDEQQLQEGSTKIEPFTKIITSGEVSWQMLSGTISDKQNWSVIVDLLSREKKNEEEEGEEKQLLKAFVLGSGSQDEDYITSAGWSVTPFIEEADLIVARGPFTIYTSDNSSSSEMKVISKNDKIGEEKYNQILELNLRKAAQLKKPMLITNPDKVRPDADLSPMPGYIGDLYQEMLNELYNGSEKEQQQGLIKRIGKPFSDVYEIALSNSSTSDKDKALMVGDALETDITGGYFAGIHTCLVVKDGVHAAAVKEKEKEFEESVTEVIESFHDNIQNTYAGELKGDESDSDGVLPSPTFVVPHFQW